MESFASRLRQIRKEYKLTQEQMGEILHVGKGQVSKFEVGKSDPSLEQIALLEAKFGRVVTQWLIFGDNNHLKVAQAGYPKGTDAPERAAAETQAAYDNSPEALIKRVEAIEAELARVKDRFRPL